MAKKELGDSIMAMELQELEDSRQETKEEWLLRVLKHNLRIEVDKDGSYNTSGGIDPTIDITIYFGDEKISEDSIYL